MRRILREQAADTYESLSARFWEIGSTIQRYFNTILGVDELAHKLIASTSVLKSRLRESAAGLQLLSEILDAEQALLVRIRRITVELQQQPINVELANSLTQANIRTLQYILATYESGKRNALFDTVRGTELRRLMEAVRIYQDVAKQLNRYLLDQHNDQLLAIYTASGELNIQAL
jgi:hypothetical protein